MTDLSNVVLVLDIDGVIRDVSGSYRRALADTVEHFTNSAYRPTAEDIDLLKAEGLWNNDWEASQELILRYFSKVGKVVENLSYEAIINFFQSRYRGTDPNNWNGYICHEPLIATSDYFQNISEAGVKWGFFSGATRASASYVLQRLGLNSPILVAMEDAPGKPDPTGLIDVVEKLASERSFPANDSTVIYVGDTVADMLTVLKAREINSEFTWLGVGVIPPHIQAESRPEYTKMLISQGADVVLENILFLTPKKIQEVIDTSY